METIEEIIPIIALILLLAAAIGFIIGFITILRELFQLSKLLWHGF